LQQELSQTRPDLQIQILGMNEIRHEIGNPAVTADRTLPWLQDVDANSDGASDNWLTAWPFAYRDVVILDENNVVIEAYNVTSHNLENEANFNELKSKLIAAAESVNTLSWTNPADALDVTNDGVVSPIDALLVINELNSNGARPLAPRTPQDQSLPYLDVNADGFVSPVDALLVLNQLNQNASVTTARAAVAANPAEGENDNENDNDNESVSENRSSLIAAVVDATFGDADFGDADFGDDADADRIKWRSRSR
jgi:hypothetical protein